MDTSLIPYLFFGLLAFAALFSIISGFRDDNQHRNDRGQHPNHPDQGRYDDHDNYGQYRPIIIYANHPDSNYGRYDRRQNGQQPFWSNAFVFIILIGGLIYFFSGKGGTDINKPAVVGPTEVKNGQQQQPTSDRLQQLVNKNYPQTSPTEKTLLTESDIEPSHPEQWFTVVSVYKSESAAEEAMKTVAATIDLKDKTIYYGKTNLNRWMVYIPVSSEREAKMFVKEINYYEKELEAFCPDQPEVLRVD